MEPFGFKTFEIASMDLLTGGKRYTQTLIGFNPMMDPPPFGGEATLMDPADPMEGDASPGLRDAVVLTTAPANYFRLIFERPRLII